MVNYKTWSNILSIVFSLFLGVFIVFLPLQVNDTNIINPIQNGPSFWGMKALAILMVLTVLSLVFSDDTRKRLTVIDALLLLGILYVAFVGGINSIGSRLDFMILGALYLSVRALNAKLYPWLVLVAIASALLQAIYGQLQLYGVYHAHHSLYGITGSFFNPAPFAGYLCMAFPIALVYYYRYHELSLALKERWQKWAQQSLKYFALAGVFAIIIVLPATRSRAAWLSVLLVGALILLKRISVESFLKKYRIKKQVALLLMALVGVMVLSGVYHLKKDSADGRLLIWQASASMIEEKPLTGWGENGFEAHYMMHQASFFDEQPNHSGIALADNVQYAYNELLKVCIEYGFVGLVLVLLIIFVVLRTKSKELAVVASKYGLLALLIFSLFSYPSDILSIKINALFFLAIVASHSKPIFSWGVMPSRILSLLLLGVSVFLFPKVKNETKDYYNALTNWRDASDIYRVEAYEECLEDFALGYPLLKTDGDFLIQYGKALSMANQDSMAIEILEGAKPHLNNTILYTALGDSYERLESYTLAEQAYRQAYRMVPNRFYPLYLLVKMYDETGQNEKALDVSEQILNKNVKIESRAIEEIKEYAQEIIDKQNVP